MLVEDSVKAYSVAYTDALHSYPWCSNRREKGDPVGIQTPSTPWD